jgi:hypothetical protein
MHVKSVREVVEIVVCDSDSDAELTNEQARALADVELQRQGFSLRGGWYVIYEDRGHNEILVRYER